MPAPKTTLSSFDILRVEPLLHRERIGRDQLPTHLAHLEHKLVSAIERSPYEMPTYVVTMNSEVMLVDIDSNESFACTLVFPRNGMPTEQQVSILSPIGAQLLGADVGALINCLPPRTRRFRVEQILFQPESAGRYDL